MEQRTIRGRVRQRPLAEAVLAMCTRDSGYSQRNAAGIGRIILPECELVTRALRLEMDQVMVNLTITMGQVLRIWHFVIDSVSMRPIVDTDKHIHN